RERLLAQSLSLLPPFFLIVSRVPYSSQVPPGGAKNHALVYNEPSGLKAAPYIDSLMIPFYKIAERCEIIYRVEQALVIADEEIMTLHIMNYILTFISILNREILKYMLNYRFNRHRINGDGSKRTSDYKCVLARHSGEEVQKVALLSAVQRRFTLSKF
ncbi:hypothetical protein ALC57_03702, partial [Trachymyrmex cornetzi]